MLNPQAGSDRLQSRPLTQRAFLAAARQTAAQHGKAARPWVQVRRHHKEGPYVLCGQVAELSSNGAEWFKVDTCAGPLWADGPNVRLCSGDGHCTCAPAADLGVAPC